MKKLISDQDKIRLDIYLTEVLEISRNQVSKLISSNKIKVNNNNVKAGYRLSIDDEIIVNDDLDFEIKLEKEDIPVDIVYEDDYLLVVNKESGMVTHPGAGNYNHTLVNALYHKLDVEKDNVRPGIVHRLDKDTSGLLVVAKDDKTLTLLSQMMKKREVERKYLALVEGVFPHNTGTIDAPLGRDPNDKLKYAVTSKNSKEARTHFKVLETFTNYSLVECTLETGRTHQIRVHFNYINYPIYNDPVYGNSKNTTPFGQFLHSYYLKFKHPILNEELEFKIDVPKEFKDVLEKLRKEDTI